MTAYFDAMRRYFDFQGHSTRSQFWLFTLVLLVLYIVSAWIDLSLRLDPTGKVLVLPSLVSLVHFIPSIAVMVRRLHDINRSGWWILINFVPLVGFIVILVFMTTPSHAEQTTAGWSPQGRNPSPGPQPTTGLAPTSSPSLDQLEKLAALRSSGALDDEEFARMKRQLLER